MKTDSRPRPMRWDGVKIAELQRLADAGYSKTKAGASLGVGRNTVAREALRHGIIFHEKLRCPLGGNHADASDDGLRRRWLTLIGPMKEQLRADVEAILKT